MCKSDFIILLIMAICLVSITVIGTMSITSDEWSYLSFRDVDGKSPKKLCGIMEELLNHFTNTNLANTVKQMCENFMEIISGTNDKSVKNAQHYIHIGLPWNDWFGSSNLTKAAMVCIGTAMSIIWGLTILTVLSLLFKINKNIRLKRYCFYIIVLTISFFILLAGLLGVIADRYSWRANQQKYDIEYICYTLYKRLNLDTSIKIKNLEFNKDQKLVAVTEKKHPCAKGETLAKMLVKILSPTSSGETNIGIDVTLRNSFYFCLLANMLILVPILFSTALYLCGKRVEAIRARTEAQIVANNTDRSRSRSRSRSPGRSRKRRQQRTDEV